MRRRSSINETGEVFVRIGKQTTMQAIGQFTIANFINDAGLEPIGGNLYRETHRFRARRWSASAAMPASAPCIRAIWKTPTSIR